MIVNLMVTLPILILVLRLIYIVKPSPYLSYYIYIYSSQSLSILYFGVAADHHSFYSGAKKNTVALIHTVTRIQHVSIHVLIRSNSESRFCLWNKINFHQPTLNLSNVGIAMSCLPSPMIFTIFMGGIPTIINGWFRIAIPTL